MFADVIEKHNTNQIIAITIILGVILAGLFLSDPAGIDEFNQLFAIFTISLFTIGCFGSLLFITSVVILSWLFIVVHYDVINGDYYDDCAILNDDCAILNDHYTSQYSELSRVYDGKSWFSRPGYDK